MLVGSHMFRECEDIVRCKAPGTLPKLAHLLKIAQDTVAAADEEMIDAAGTILGSRSGEFVLAEAMGAKPDWLIPHDKEHFLKLRQNFGLPFWVGTPGDLIQFLEDHFTGD